MISGRIGKFLTAFLSILDIMRRHRNGRLTFLNTLNPFMKLALHAAAIAGAEQRTARLGVVRSAKWKSSAGDGIGGCYDRQDSLLVGFPL